MITKDVLFLMVIAMFFESVSRASRYKILENSYYYLGWIFFVASITVFVVEKLP